MTDKELEEFIHYGETNFAAFAMMFGEGWAGWAIDIAKELRARLAQGEPEELGEIIPADEEQLKRIAKLVEPEPVAWAVRGLITDFSRDFSAYQTKTYTVPLYTAPPQREWQGLTDAEVEEAFFEIGQFAKIDLKTFARAIEAKLKEKNHAN